MPHVHLEQEQGQRPGELQVEQLLLQVQSPAHSEQLGVRKADVEAPARVVELVKVVNLFFEHPGVKEQLSVIGGLSGGGSCVLGESRSDGVDRVDVRGVLEA